MAPVIALARYAVGVPVDGSLIHRVHLRRLRLPTCGRYFLSHPVQPCESTPSKVDRRSLSSESARNRPADRTTASVNHGVLVLK